MTRILDALLGSYPSGKIATSLELNGWIARQRDNKANIVPERTEQ
jgi:hypothetical protein